MNMGDKEKKIFIESETFNEIMRVCSPAVSAGDSRLVLRFIKIECNGQGEGCATALDGFVLSQFRFACDGDACEGLIPPCKKARKECLVEIGFTEYETSVYDGETKTIFKVPAAGMYINHAKITSEAQGKEKRITMVVNPHILKQVIKSHADKRNALYLDIYGETDAIVVHTDTSAGLLLPIKSYVEKAPEFWGVTADEEDQQQAEGRTV